MTAAGFTALFVAAIVVMLALRLALARRQIAHVAQHRAHVPPAFATRIAESAHHKAADYTIARQKLGIVETLVETALLLALTLGGGLAALVAWTGAMDVGWLGRDLALLVSLAIVSGIVGLPFGWYSTFRVEQRFGFNRMTTALWLADLAKGIALSVVIGLPLAALVLWMMRALGSWWWLWAWAAFMAFQLGLLMIYPTLIAPLFNKFSPLPAGTARERIEQLLQRCGFRASGLFVMDGSKRSAHGNAYFTGFGKSKRVVFFDTLLDRLDPDELEAVLAHELGHFKLRHIAKRIAASAALSLGFLALLAWVADKPWFEAGLGLAQGAGERPGVTLALFALALPVFTFPLGPISALVSRKHEFEADAFAAGHASALALVRALVKLYEDNASTLTPDPLHSAFYDSHPPAATRIARLEAFPGASMAR